MEKFKYLGAEYEYQQVRNKRVLLVGLVITTDLYVQVKQ